MRLSPVLVISHLLCATAPLGAQLYVGPRVGATSAIQRPSFDYYQRLTGGTAGVNATLELSSWIAVEAEASYVQKGARYDRTYQMRLDYVETPVLLRLGSPLGASTIRPFLVGGIAPAEELRCSGYTGQIVFGGALTASAIPPGTRLLNCDDQRSRHADFSSVLGGGFSF